VLTEIEFIKQAAQDAGVTEIKQGSSFWKVTPAKEADS
jgi:hypothetical protein